MFFRFLNKLNIVRFKINFILVYPCRFLAIVVSDNEFKTKKNVILFRDKIEPQRVQHLPMCACFVIYDYYR